MKLCTTSAKAPMYSLHSSYSNKQTGLVYSPTLCNGRPLCKIIFATTAHKLAYKN
jgi:hypothetical protein